MEAEGLQLSRRVRRSRWHHGRRVLCWDIWGVTPPGVVVGFGWRSSVIAFLLLCHGSSVSAELG